MAIFRATINMTEIYFMMLSDTNVIPDLRANIFIVTRSLQKGFQATPEVKAPISKKTFLEFVLTIKW